MRLTALARSAPKRIVAQGVPLPAPVGGWDAISPLANMPIDRAVQIDNWVCRPGWIEPRKGYVTYSTGVGTNTTPVETVMAYNGLTGTSALFAAAGTSLYNCTGGGAATPVGGITLSNARLQYCMMGSASAASYLIACNGADTPIAYNGTSWSQLSIQIGNAYGSITWAVNMIQGETINLNGTVVTFVTGSPSGNQVQIGANLAATLTSLVTFLSGSADSNISQCTYSQSLGTTLSIIYKNSGYAGNSFTISAGYATGDIVFSTNPNNGDTITLDGTVVTFAVNVEATNTFVATANLNAGDVIVIAGKAYTLVAAYTNIDGDVVVGASESATLSNLAAAVNLGPGSGTVYAAAMTANNQVSATSSSTTLNVTALIPGPNFAACSYSPNGTAHGAWSSTTLTGGQSPGTNQVLIGASLSATLTNLLSVLQTSSNGGINQFTYSLSGGTTLNIQAASSGILGNALTIAASAATASGATLVGGST